ncbi:MAG: arginine deiminase-related protein [Bacteroidota bacterium]|nr:arginine deiminase-related protein [Bacteroidota bacterium]
MIRLNIHNEVDSLESVILGIASNFGGTPKIDYCYDPKSKYHVMEGTFPVEEDLLKEIEYFYAILSKYKVKVYMPKDINLLNQIFTRDIGFVIHDKFFISNTIKDRSLEIDGLEEIFQNIDSNNIINIPDNVSVEGGDIILCNKHLFIGYSKTSDFDRYKVARTNEMALPFLQQIFSGKDIIGFELNKSDDDPRKNILHLDCCFQPIGNSCAILYPEGFCNQSDVDFLVNYFGEQNIIFIDQNEMLEMYANIFSISSNIIVSDKKFIRLNSEFKKRGFIVEEINYRQVSKMGGLFRCSTLPLSRK